ncbi:MULTISPECIES: PTS sugar transporter subunit IIA [Clostridium]|uniref:PTS sugar transporter subunit IIA n=1 Tax=Clostridium TaxID=1485 RepID=UPI00082555DD|nr:MULTISPECIES: PTS glucose transporter subunit IIA [Clostridium]PJI09087.1 PTS glucose transporter subunit IIA [Clostridium sp. CT7]
MLGLLKKSSSDIVAVSNAIMFPIEEVKDQVFSQKLMGDGVAFKLLDNTISSPCDGEITTIFPTGHAFGITRSDGVEILVHIGIDTVNLKGEGFTILSSQGKKIKHGEPVIKLDLDLLKQKNVDLSTMLIITNSNGKDIHFIDYGQVSNKQKINL